MFIYPKERENSQEGWYSKIATVKPRFSLQIFRDKNDCAKLINNIAILDDI